MVKFYSVEELRNAEIYDSLGLYYGNVCGVEYREDEPRIKACIIFKAEEAVPDTKRIRELLEAKGVKVGEESLEILVLLAREHGLDIPYRVVEKNVEMVKGFIKVAEIKLIDTYSELARKNTIILLNSPREARYRGRPLKQEKPAPKPEYIRGKTVVSLREGVLGKAVDIVIGPGQPGLRVKRFMGGGYIAWLKFLNDLKTISRKYYEILAVIRDPLIHRRISIEEYDTLVETMRSKGVPEEIIKRLDNYIEASAQQNIYIDIPWSDVEVVNDIIVIK